MPAAFAAMVAAALLLPTPADRLRASIGLPAFLLGLASVPYLPAFRGPALGVWISGALLLLGPALLLLATWRARTRLRSRVPVGAAAVLAATAGVAAGWPTLDKGGAFSATVAAGAVGFDAMLLWMVGTTLGIGRAVRWLDARLPALPSRHGWGVLALVAAALSFRVGGLIWPLWVLSWQPIGVGVGVLCAWWAVATGRASLLLAGAALGAAFCSVDRFEAGWVLLCAAALADAKRPNLVAAVAAFGAYLAVPTLLASEVVFTVLFTLAATALLGVLAARHNEEEPAPR